MIRKITLLFLLCLGLQQATYAQTCGFDAAHQELMNQDPAYAARVSQYLNGVQQWMNANQNTLTMAINGDTLWEIPVVVHVMHTGGAIGSPYNITDGRIDTTIDYLNKTFAAAWPSYPAPGSGGTKVPFRFVLAKRAPDCTPTNGINRVDVTAVTDYGVGGYDYAANGVRRSNATGVRDDSLKRLSLWPSDRYYNIWVVNKIDGVDGLSPGSFVAGYAYLPPAPANIDGTVMLASQVNKDKITLPHEIGHAMGLLHTFQGPFATPPAAPCPINNNCSTDGDFCCDTQPHIQPSNVGLCPTGTFNACFSANFDDATAKNIMNYTSCQDRFTPNQRDRAIASFVAYRSSLISSSASVPLPVTSLPTVCQPGITNSSSAFNSGPRRVRIFDAGRTYLDVNSSGYGGDGNISYRDMTCQHQVALKAGNTYTLSFTSTFSDAGAAFIDFNNDGLLGNSTGERIAIVDNLNGDVHSATFTVPLTATACTPVRMRVISDRTSAYIDSCSNRVHGQTEDFEVLIYGSNSNSASVTLQNPPGGGNPSCIGTTLTMRATASTGTTVVGWQWYINGVLVSGQTADTFQWNGFANDDTVRVALHFSDVCGVDTVFSDSILVKRVPTVAPVVTIGVTAGTNPTCIDDTVTLSVVSNVNPGASPTYQWRSNGIDIPGATGTTFKAYARGGEKITVRMVSSAGSPCADPGFAVSNEIEIQYTTKVPIANIALTIGTNPGCAGQPLQFTVTPTTGGTAPTYQWTVNNVPVPGASNTNFNTSTLNNGDQVRVIMTSNSACASPATVTSSAITVIHEKITADITIAQSTGTNPTCEGKPVIFSANTTNAGKNPTYQWLVNGMPIGGAVSPIYVTDSLRNNDAIRCVLIATDPCVSNPNDTSSSIVMSVTPSKRPKVAISITAGKNPGCLDSLIELTAVPTDLGTAPEYAWLVNGFPAGTGSVFSNSSLLNGNVVMLRANQTDGGCYLPDTVFSDPLVMVRSVTPKEPIISLIGNMIYTNFDSSFIWFGPDGQMPDGPEGKAYPGKIGPYYAITNNNGCWSKPSNILQITLLDITGLDVANMEVYPNPTNDKLILDWKGQSVDYSITVHNALGQVVKSETAKNVSKKELSLGSLASGNYFIMLKDTEGRVGVVRVTVNKQ